MALKGRVSLDAGRLWIGDGSSMVVCDDKNDDIDIRVMNNGMLAITPFVFNQGLEVAHSVEDVKDSYFCFHKGRYSLTLSDKSLLYVGKQGHFELNSLYGKYSPGLLKYFFMLRDGVCRLHPDALFTMGPNRGDGRAKRETPFLQVVAGGTIQGRGTVELVGTPLRGRANDVGQVSLQEFTAAKLVKGLLNEGVGRLKAAVLFEDDKTGGKKLMLKPKKHQAVGKIISLEEGDEVISDDPRSGTVFLQNYGNPVTITSDGVRTDN